MLNLITPLILTFNEAPNLARTLAQLFWARDITIIDSFSSDETLSIVSGFPQARIFQRKFDSFAGQCNFGLRETGITSEWVLSLDADYVVTDEMIEELTSLNPNAHTDGFRAGFTYCIHGRQLRSGLYPPVTVLFRRLRATSVYDGHSHRGHLAGSVATLRSRA